MTNPEALNPQNLNANLDYSDTLRSLMNTVGILSFRELSRRADVSLWQVQQLRKGQIEHMRLAPLIRLSQCLNSPLSEFIETLSNRAISVKQHQDDHQIHSPGIASDGISHQSPHHSDGAPNTVDAHRDVAKFAALQSEYDRLQQQMSQQREQANEDFLRSALEMLESWMIQWPTAAYAAHKNDTIPASRLIPLVRPVERLLEDWGIEAIATVGEDVVYDPTMHQLMSGTAQSGDSVRVRYIGYRHRGKLLYRAKVSPI